ncbi:unnamed protein product [Ectocarpus sp. CCAP 1310/34]|nr:unnamed protein product [Ectocarpus sp. CCAP 1310/34]
MDGARGRRCRRGREHGRRSHSGVFTWICVAPSLGGNLYLFVALDSAPRWNKIYGLRRKSDALAATKRLQADVGRYDLGRIECYRIDNGTEWTRGEFRRFRDDNGIGVEFTPPGVPQYNGVVQSAIWRIMKAGMAARRSAARVLNVDYASIPGLDPRGDRLWLVSAKWAADAFNQSATKANPGRRSPHELFTGQQGPFRVLPFFQLSYMREDRRTKLDDQATLCYYLNGGDNPPSGTVKVLKAPTGRVVYTNNVSWVASSPAGEGGSAGIPAAPTPPPFTPVVLINFGPAPTPSTAAQSPPAHTPTPSPAPAPGQPPSAASPSSSATPAPGQTPSATSPSPSATPSPVQLPPLPPPPPPPGPALPPLSAHAMRQLRPGKKAEGMKDPRLPGRTRSGTRHSTGLISILDKNTLVSMLEAQSAMEEKHREPGGAGSGETGGAETGEQGGALAAVDLGAGGAGFSLACATLLANREPGGAGSGETGGAETGEQGGALAAVDLGAGGAGFSLACATLLANRLDIDAMLRDQRPPEQRPDHPHCQASDLRIPKSYDEAMASEYRHLCGDSMKRELFELLEAGTFLRRNEFGWATKAKSRLVARGDMQREYIDFGELYAPTVSVSCVRMLAALACELNLDLCHFDIEHACVRSELEEDVYMRWPQGCGALSGMIVKLGKSLYGLRQASRQWHAMLKRLTISQQTFTDELAAEYGVAGGKSVPMSSGFKLSDFDADEEATDFPFREIVGPSMWLAAQTRPDIANAVRAVARYCASQKQVYWDAAMGILGGTLMRTLRARQQTVGR